MDLTPEATAARPAFSSYCKRRGLEYYRDWGLPEATQFLRRGSMQVVPNAGNGTMVGGIEDAWLAHVGYIEGGSEIELSTVAVAHVPASAGFAVRVLCHDRDLSERDTTNEGAAAEVIELDDRDVQLESEGFLRRYRLSTDHDQDQLTVWQLFSPALIHWLTDAAPENFSFELQDGALSCFVPGAVADAEQLDDLCRAANRLLERINELGAENPSTVPVGITRDRIVESELAAHPFPVPPKSVWAAARRFGFWLLPGSRAWRLGNEAFFRAYSTEIGFRQIEETAFRASHYGTPIPGEITQVSTGRLEGIDYDAHLIFTKDSSFGWLVLVVDVGQDFNTFAFAGLPETETARARDLEITGTNDAVVVFKADGGPRRRTRKRLDDFIAEARKLLIATVAAGRPR